MGILKASQMLLYTCSPIPDGGASERDFLYHWSLNMELKTDGTFMVRISWARSLAGVE